jgi:hypothetical protein
LKDERNFTSSSTPKIAHGRARTYNVQVPEAPSHTHTHSLCPRNVAILISRHIHVKPILRCLFHLVLTCVHEMIRWLLSSECAVQQVPRWSLPRRHRVIGLQSAIQHPGSSPIIPCMNTTVTKTKRLMFGSPTDVKILMIQTLIIFAQPMLYVQVPDCHIIQTLIKSSQAAI